MATATASEDEFEVTAVVPLELARRIRTNAVSASDNVELATRIGIAIRRFVLAEKDTTEIASSETKEKVSPGTAHITITVPATVALIRNDDTDTDVDGQVLKDCTSTQPGKLNKKIVEATKSKLDDIIAAVKDLPLSDFGIKSKVCVQTQFSASMTDATLLMRTAQPLRPSAIGQEPTNPCIDSALERDEDIGAESRVIAQHTHNRESDEKITLESSIILQYTYQGEVKQLSFTGEKTLLGLATALAQEENLPLHEQSLTIDGHDKSIGTCKGCPFPTIVDF